MRMRSGGAFSPEALMRYYHFHCGSCGHKWGAWFERPIIRIPGISKCSMKCERCRALTYSYRDEE